MRKHLTTTHRFTLILLASLVGVLLALTWGPTARILAQVRETRTVGQITITADDFIGLSGNLTQATGNIWLGAYLEVAGPGANLIFDTATITGTGTLGYIAESLPLFSGGFVADGATGLALPTSVIYNLNQVAGFDADTSLRINQVDLVQALTAGETTLLLTPPGVNASAPVTFTLAPGAVFGGTAGAFQLNTAGVTLSVPAGATLSNGQLSAPQVSLALPAGLGGASANINNLTVTPSSLNLGKAGAAFDLPDMLYGDGSHLSLTGNQALFSYNASDDEYRLVVSSTLTIDLPENHQSKQLTVELQHEHGESNLSGTLDQLSLTMAGTSLEMHALTLDNTGLGVLSATLTLPQALGGSRAVVSNVHLGGSGLTIGTGQAQFSFPNIQIGDGDELSLHYAQALLAVYGADYRIDVSADLILNLPENNLTIAANFSLANGQISGTLDALHLSVAGTNLAMDDVSLSNQGLEVMTATLTLPAALGGATTFITDVQIGDQGLVFGQAGVAFAIPDIVFSSSSQAASGRVPGLAALAAAREPALSLTGNQASLETQVDGSGFIFKVDGTLNVNLPGNAQLQPFTFILEHNHTSGFLIQGTLAALDLNIANASLDLNKLTLGNQGFSVDTASLTMPEALGSAVVTLEQVTINGDGLQINNGRFELPDLTLADGKIEFQDTTASLQAADGGYSFQANSTLSLHLPENEQSIAMDFQVDRDGNLQGSLSALSLKLAGATLALKNVALSNTGLAAGSASLQMPATLGGASASIDEVLVTSSGLTFGTADLKVSLPDIHFGEQLSFIQNNANLSITTGGAQYLLTVASQMDVNLPENDQHQAITFTLKTNLTSYAMAGTVSGLNLNVAGLTLKLEQLKIQEDGLHVDTATLVLPPDLGGGTVTIDGVSITSAGLSMGQANAQIPLPDISFGGTTAQSQLSRAPGLSSLIAATDAAPLALHNNLATLKVQGDRFRFSVSSQIQINLPDNAQTSAFNFTIEKAGESYLLSGTLSQLSLNIAGANLAMTSLALDNRGLNVSLATLTLPESLGGAVTLKDIRIGSAGLSIGSGTFNLPDIVFGGDGSQIKITSASVALEVDHNSYGLSGSGTLQLRLPDNSQDIALSFSLQAGEFDASLSAIDLKVAGAGLALRTIDFDNQGLTVLSASLTLPSSLGGASASLNNVAITEDGLSIGGGSFSLPEVRIGDGSKVKITAITAELTMLGKSYNLSACGTLNLNLPGNSQTIQIEFTLNSDGTMTGKLDQLRLTVAGATLSMQQIVLNNSGLTVASATLQLPESLGGETGTVTGVTIKSSGLSISGGSISLPDIKIGDGSKVKIDNPKATISAGSAGYTFGINGTLMLRLPQNSQDIAIQANMDPQGHISAQVDELTLNMASLSLKLTGVVFNNQGLSVAKGTLQLPSSLGSASGEVDNVSVDGDGLHIGGAGATFAFPDFKMGSSSGFSVTNVKATLLLANDRSYKVSLAGTVGIEAPGTNASATGSISVDSHGNLSGSVSAFDLTVAGLELTVTDVKINGDTLSAASAVLKIPSEWGGASAAVYNVTVSPGNGISIGGGKFTMPNIDAGGFSLKGVYGELKNTGNGYQISGGGQFGVPGLGEGGSCAIGVDATIFVNSMNALVLKLSEPQERQSMSLVQPASPLLNNNFSFAPTGPESVSLRDVKLGLYGCTVPIGATGFGLTRVEGEVSLSSGSTIISLGVSVESTNLMVAGHAALRGDLDMSLSTNPAQFGLTGSLYVFAFHAGQLEATIKESDGFRATLWIEAIVARGQFSVHAWSSAGDFHLTGSATIDIGIPEGEIWSGCVPYPCCSVSCHWVHKWWGGYPSCSADCSWCHTCVTIPPSDWELGTVNAEFGEFVVSNGTAYGFKGWVSLMGYDAGFFVDDKGDLSVGNVDKYHLLDANQVAAARRLQKRLQENGLIAADDPWTSGPLTLLPNGDVYLTVPISQTTDILFSMSRNSDEPVFTLIDPQGKPITPDSLPANVLYSQTVTSSLGIPAEMAQLAAAGIAGASKLYQTSPDLFAATDVISQPLQTCLIQPLALTGSDQARLRLMNAAPGLQPVDLLSDDTLLSGPISTTLTSAYLQLASGTHTFKLVPAGTTQSELISATLQLEAGKDYSLVLIEDGGAAQMLLLPDNNSLPKVGKARLRFVQASPQAGELDLLVQGGQALLIQQTYQTIPQYTEIAAGTYDFELRSTKTMTAVLDLPGITLAEGTVNTLVVYDDPSLQSTVQAFNSIDARRPARLQFVNASQNEPVVDVSVQGTTIFSSVVFSDTTSYLPLEPGSQEILLSDAVNSNQLATAGLNLPPNSDNTLVLYGPAGNLQTLYLPDDNTIPAFGKARLRFVHLSPESPAGGGSLSIKPQGGPTWFSNVLFESVSDYITVEAGTYTLEVRSAGIVTPTLTYPNITFSEGSVVTLVAMTEVVKGNPALQLTIHSDAKSSRNEQLTYSVDQAQTGVWTVKLSGDIGPEESYLVSILGSNPPPALSEVTVSQSDSELGQVGWRLTSDEIATQVDVYVTTGPITHTQIITGADGLPVTLTQPLYTGIALAKGIHGPVDGTPYTYALDLSQLESGIYWVWLEAEDGRNPPVRIYAPARFEINHDPSAQNQGKTEPIKWDADLTIASGYRQLLPSWDRYPNPDIDSYVLFLSESPGKATHLQASEVITVENRTSAVILSLDPGKTYYLAVQALDKETGWSALSAELSAKTQTAEFSLTGPTQVHLTGGLSQAIALELTTDLAPYPEMVGLSIGCVHLENQFSIYLPLLLDGLPIAVTRDAVLSSAASLNKITCEALDGIDVDLTQPFGLPLQSGQAISLALSTTVSLPDGHYLLPVLATGGGVTHALEIELVVHEPRFSLQAEPAVASLARGESTEVRISAEGTNGEADAIFLELVGAPAGLSWGFNPPVIHPGESITLTLTDTLMADHGSYALSIVGEDGENSETAGLTLNLAKPEYKIEFENLRLQVRAGETAAFGLDVSAINGWTLPVMLTLSEKNLPPQTSAGFISGPARQALEGLAGSPIEISLVPPASVYLVVVTSPNTPAGTYRVMVEGRSGQLEDGLTLMLDVYDEEIAPVPVKWFTYMPLINVPEVSVENLAYPGPGVTGIDSR